MEEFQELRNKLQQLKLDQKEIQRDIKKIELKILINEREIITINKQLEKNSL